MPIREIADFTDDPYLPGQVFADHGFDALAQLGDRPRPILRFGG
jgi:hypothetical protein